jgi:hypothetical protein
MLISFMNGQHEGDYLLSPYMEIALIIHLFIIILMYLKCLKLEEKQKSLSHLIIAFIISGLFSLRYFDVIPNYYMP